jgi:hypothetical protein
MAGEPRVPSLLSRSAAVMRRHGRITAVGFLVVGLVLGGLIGLGLGGSSPHPTWPQRDSPRIDLIRGRYVALGDSYSAGEGLAPFLLGTGDIERGGDRCHKSLHNAYPLLVAFKRSTVTVFRACSGAIAKNIYNSVQDHGGTLDRDGLQVGPGILGDDVSLVTLTMGGNDVHFANALNFCFSTRNCPEKPYQGAPSLREWMEKALAKLAPHLFDVYRRIRLDAPNARILILGYPSLFPEKAPSFLNPRNTECTLLFSRWDALERTAIRQWGLSLALFALCGAANLRVDRPECRGNDRQGHEQD